ncbi:MAG: hypothetical protein RL662_1723 [Bacteroidota bacterium]
MYFKDIVYQSSEYLEMINLRHKVLREPLGLHFSDDDLRAEGQDQFLGLYTSRAHTLVACCVLTFIDATCCKLRQMAVVDDFQNQGVGKKLLLYAEDVAKQEGGKLMVLHARKSAVCFYQKSGYELVGEEFIEVGILHVKMKKDI